jgi:dynein heavy chain
VNLRFELEEEENFQRKLEAAQYYRESSEIYLKFNYMIDSMQTKTEQIKKDSLERIVLFAARFCFKIEKLREIIGFYYLPPSIKYNCKYQLSPKLINNKNTAGEQQLLN